METVTRVEPKWLRFAPTADARSVAALRIAVGVSALMATTHGWNARSMASVPSELWVPPPGMGWVADLLPVNPQLYAITGGLFVASTVAVLIGWRARLAAWVAVAAGLYAGFIPHLAWKVDHYHIVLWMLAVIAVSPADDTWAVKPSGRRHRREDYAVPVLATTVILGVIYLFSATQKLASGGLDWALSDNMLYVMWSAWWAQGAALEGNWLIQQPAVYKMMALGGLAFELAFLPLALHPKGRRLVRWGFLFHLTTGLILGIWFLYQTVLYVAFFQWGQPREDGEPFDAQRLRRWTITVIIVGASIFGMFGVAKAWPFAAYPPFPVRSEAPVGQTIYLTTEAGERVLLSESAAADGLPRRIRYLAANSDRQGFLRWVGGVDDETYVSVGAALTDLSVRYRP